MSPAALRVAAWADRGNGTYGSPPREWARDEVARDVVRAADWPGWRGVNRDAISSETGLLPEWGPGGPPVAWKTTGIGAGLSSVSVVGERIYTMGDVADAQYVIALNRADGKIIWKTRVGAAWQDEYGGPRGTPTVDGELVYAIAPTGSRVPEAATGKERWRTSLPRDFGGSMMSSWKFSESPLVDGDRVVFTPGARDAAVVAADKKTGRRSGGRHPDLGPRGRDGAAYSSGSSRTRWAWEYVQLSVAVSWGSAPARQVLWGYNRVEKRRRHISHPSCVPTGFSPRR